MENKEEVKCNPHPDAPHGFMRNASHTQDRYVCECEFWESEDDELIDIEHIVELPHD